MIETPSNLIVAIEGYNQEKLGLLKMIESANNNDDSWKAVSMYKRLREIDETIKKILTSSLAEIKITK